MRKLILIRHGATNWNAEKRIQGRRDISLNNTGILQAKYLSSILTCTKLSAVYSSPVRRAFETAGIIARPHGLKISLLEEVTEVDVGTWEGKLLSELQSESLKWTDQCNEFNYVMLPGCESIEEVCRRAIAGIEKIRQQDSDNVVVVSHGDVIKIIICQYLGLSLMEMSRFSVGLCSMSILSFKIRSVLLELLNFPVGLNSVNVDLKAVCHKMNAILQNEGT
jgi:broad specificity phosphatase PhoE